MTWDQLVSVPNFSWMVVILVRRHVPMLDNGGTGLTDPKKEIMTRKIYETNANHGPEYNKILINHWRWLKDQGPSYTHQAASCKLQAASLTRRLYGVIGESRRKKLCKQKTL